MSHSKGATSTQIFPETEKVIKIFQNLTSASYMGSKVILQKDLAIKLHMFPQTISMILARQRNVPFTVISDLINDFGINPLYIFNKYGHDEPMFQKDRKNIMILNPKPTAPMKTDNFVTEEKLLEFMTEFKAVIEKKIEERASKIEAKIKSVESKPSSKLSEGYNRLLEKKP